MTQVGITEDGLKQILKEVIVEVLEERREYLRDVIEEVLDDFEMIEEYRENRRADVLRPRSVLTVREGEA